MAGEGGAETPGAPVLCRTVVFRTDAGSGEHQAVAAVPLARGARRVLRENSLAGGDRCAAPKALGTIPKRVAEAAEVGFVA